VKKIDLHTCENELKKRWELPYLWGKKQNDEWDNYSKFIYEIDYWEQLLLKINQVSKDKNLNNSGFLNYSANRWYNFKSAMALESIFTQLEGVVPTLNHKNKLVDFHIAEIEFDHKTSVFPKAFGHNLIYAQQYPKSLITWLYKNQSTQGRQHFANRLFLIVYSEKGNHWKLKAEISWLKKIIEDYVANFKEKELHKIEIQPGKAVFSDIIWAIK